MNELHFDKASKEIARDFKIEIMPSILFVDDALREFFQDYAQRPGLP